VIQELGKCDFTPIATHVNEQRENKKKATPEEKKAKKEEQKQLLDHYGWAVVDRHKEKV
jgi:DNA topoisomerase-1